MVGMKEGEPRLFSYIVEWDAGLAPNPWWEHCTLAVCKPQIRGTASEGDWIVGLSPKRLGYRLVYAMQVCEVLAFDEYFREPKYAVKVPDLESIDPRKRMGDNMYYQNEDGEYIQLPSAHSNPDGSTNWQHYRRDLNGGRVLAGAEYYYFGQQGLAIPASLDFLQVRRGHRCRFSLEQTREFLRYIEKLEPGIQGAPRDLERALKRLTG